MASTKPVCLVTGVGPEHGTGADIAKRFSEDYASIDTPRTRPILAPDQPDEFFAKTGAIADEIFHVAHQDRSTWSFLVELRPFGETW